MIKENKMMNEELFFKIPGVLMDDLPKLISCSCQKEALSSLWHSYSQSLCFFPPALSHPYAIPSYFVIGIEVLKGLDGWVAQSHVDLHCSRMMLTI